jgi:large subunit ribosomal protein L6
MSRVGKKPIKLPDRTSVTYQDKVVTVKGEKGSLSKTIPASLDLKIDSNVLMVLIQETGRKNRAMQGLVRSLLANMVTGVSKGFERVLEINGIGYRADVQGNKIVLALGYSHPIDFNLPDGISASIDKNNVIRLNGIDKELLGHTAALIRKLRPPEPYKGKGIKYAEERIQKKAGKSGTK